jgi:GH25 family lysozyme M1 (1,4-beta-N-acetylmuramidase)
MEPGRRAAFVNARQLAARMAARAGARAGVPIVLALTLLTIVPIGPGIADAAGTRMTANCEVNARLRPNVYSRIRVKLGAWSVVTVAGTVAGGWYQAGCNGSVRGRYWYAISVIGNRSVRSLYGMPTLYVAAGLFRSASEGSTAGMDVSQWNGSIDFARARASGVRFVYLRATAGGLTTDSSYARNMARAGAAGLAVGAYHYAHPDLFPGDAIREADHFVATAHLAHGMLLPALDLETGQRLGTARLQRWVMTWLARVYQRTGAKAVIYTTQSFWQSYMDNSTWFAAHGYRVLWVARWATTTPRVPAAGWGGYGWSMWQYTDCGRVPGVSSDCVDLDRFRGTDLWSLIF